MGMDLYSVEGGQYYRFNWSGWSVLCDFLEGLNCDLSEFSGSNNGDEVSEDTCLAIADRLDEVKAELSRLIKSPAKNLPLEMTAKEPIYFITNAEQKVDIRCEVIKARMKGEKLTVSSLRYNDDAKWDLWNNVAYYLAFGKFCRKCSELGGFSQC